MNNKKIVIITLIISIILIVVIGTYAFFTWTSPNTSLTLEVGSVDVIFQEGNDINATNIGPVLNYEDGEITEFMIINNSEEEQIGKFYLNITNISDSLKNPTLKYILQTSTDNSHYVTYKEENFVNANTGEFIILENEILPSGQTYYRFIIYIDGNMENPTTMMNSNLNAIFNVSASLPPISGVELAENIKATANSGTPNFGSAATTNEGVYSAQDDYGTTYYFRGAATNNYVKFAGFYWRIVRINGDGSLRLIYDGTSAHANGESSDDRQIGTSAFNESNDDNAYLGYMYGTPGSNTYEETHANTNNSTIKTVVDNWYKTNIEDKGYSDKVANVIYCNDRQIDTTYGTALGYGANQTGYMTRYRLSTNKSPILTCSQKNDAFTVSDTSRGNGALTYPVGLITADEIAMGGGANGTNNSDYYLYTGQYYWTMSPSYFYGNALEWRVYTNGNVNNINVINNHGVRPVLSLKSNISVTGSGTQSDPYVVQN